MTFEEAYREWQDTGSVRREQADAVERDFADTIGNLLARLRETAESSAEAAFAELGSLVAFINQVGAERPKIIEWLTTALLEEPFVPRRIAKMLGVGILVQRGPEGLSVTMYFGADQPDWVDED